MASKAAPLEKPTDAPELPGEVRDQLAALDFTVPEFKKMSNGEAGGLGAEALEGYAYGERRRYDTQGRRWDFVREAVADQFRLTVRCSVGGITLSEGAIPLNRIAGKEGEEELLALVERCIAGADDMAKRFRAFQLANRPEAEEQPPAPVVRPDESPPLPPTEAEENPPAEPAPTKTVT